MPSLPLPAHLQLSGYQGRRLQLGVCGSVAAYKALDLLRRFKQVGADVGATLTDSAERFVTPLSFEALGASPVYTSIFADGAQFGHLEPGAACDAFVIAPATAATMAHLAYGMADDILSCQALAFPKPLVIAPAMNPRMWANAATQENWAKLRARGHICIEPACGLVACGEEGKGRFPDTEEIVLAGLKAMTPQDYAGKKVMLTLGPTRERWDAVRFWSNPSSGIMGASFAIAAYLRGAEVHAVCGEGTPWLPEGVTRYNVGSAAEMFTAAEDIWTGMDAGIFTAAVADFYPVPYGNEKFKKTGCDGFSIEFAPNKDILKTLGHAKKAHQKVVGFAAESGDMKNYALGKLQAKNADMVVGNTINTPHSGFGTPTNVVFVADKNGRQEEWGVLPKADIARRVLDWFLQL